MKKEQLRKFREHYFRGSTLTITKSRLEMCNHFKEYGVTERTARNWESGQRTIPQWFVKVASDFDVDNILKEKTP